MRNAVKSAAISPDDIGYLNAHATSTPLGDALETMAMRRLFGGRADNHTLLISSTKSMTGHLLGGAGGLEAGITILALRDQIAPPTTNLMEADPECTLNYVPNTPQKGKFEYALSNSFGFGGTNGSLVFKRWTEDSV
jgi:3-oxoacyl-[acyl-carrier-protein] synthase II